MGYNGDCRAWLYFNDSFYKIWRNEREYDLIKFKLIRREES